MFLKNTIKANILAIFVWIIFSIILYCGFYFLDFWDFEWILWFFLGEEFFYILPFVLILCFVYYRTSLLRSYFWMAIFLIFIWILVNIWVFGFNWTTLFISAPVSFLLSSLLTLILLIMLYSIFCTKKSSETERNI